MFENFAKTLLSKQARVRSRTRLCRILAPGISKELIDILVRLVADVTAKAQRLEEPGAIDVRAICRNLVPVTYKACLQLENAVLL